MLSEAILDVLLKKYFKVKKWLNPQVALQSIKREQDLKGIFIGKSVNIFFAFRAVKLFEKYFLFVSCWVVLALALTILQL